MRDTLEFFDLVSLVAIMLMSVTVIVFLAAEWTDTGITTIQDKSISYISVDSQYDNYTGEDICAMLCSVDINTPEPRAFKFNYCDTIIRVDSAWLAEKGKNILKIMNDSEFNLKNRLTSKVKSIEYEYNNGDPYYLITFW